jgi:ATP-dependent RNA helicase RhlE
VGDALTLVAPDEETGLRDIERAVGSRFTRAQLPGFDYTRRAAEKLEIPLAERIAAIRARKAEDRRRARLNAERRAGGQVLHSDISRTGRLTGPRKSVGM